MRRWLAKHKIEYDENDLKADLMTKIVKAKPTKMFQTDTIAEILYHSAL